ncbi:MAG: hypothetical protein K2W96_01695 [Gemmataceae bacterium]|nr:hypothetical protein [Gemmataceae bacterium]
MLPLLLLFASPLDVVPASSDFFLEVRAPRALAEGALGHKRWKEAAALPVVKEQLDGTVLRRSSQLLAHFERGLGAKWPQLLDDLAGNGLVLAGKQGNGQPALLVAEGKDAKRQDRLAALLVELANDELARQGAKAKVAEGKHREAKVWSVGEAAFLARFGPFLALSNKPEAIKAAIDLHAGEGKAIASHPGMKGFAKLLPEGSAARAWLSLKAFQASKAGKELYAEPRDNFLSTLFFGGYLSVFGRAPCVAAALVPGKDGFTATLRVPVGRKDMGADKHLHAPEAAIPSLLEPEGVLYSLSWAYDFAALWHERDKLFNPAQAKGLADSDKNPVLALAGAKPGTLLQAAGAAHRFVIVHRSRADSRKQPATLLPSFVFVTQPRDAEKFGKALDASLRGAGAIQAAALGLLLKEEKHAGTTLTGYRFSETKALEGDPTDYRYNFSPCWGRSGGKFVLSTTFEGAKATLDALAKEKPGKLPGRMADKLYPSGFAALMEAGEDALVAQTVLGQAASPDEARSQVKALTALVKSLGGIGTSSAFGDDGFRFDVWFKAG